MWGDSMCLCVPHVCRKLWSLKEGMGYPGTGVTSGYEPSCVGAGNLTWDSVRAVSTLSSLQPPICILCPRCHTVL